MAPSIGDVLRQAREVRQLSASETARAARISPAYLSRLENDAVKRPSPHVLHQLSEALAMPHAELLRSVGYRLPDAPALSAAASTIGQALFADLTDDEREAVVEYLAWYRSRHRRTGRGANGAAAARRMP